MPISTHDVPDSIETPSIAVRESLPVNGGDGEEKELRDRGTDWTLDQASPEAPGTAVTGADLFLLLVAVHICYDRVSVTGNLKFPI